MIFEYKSCEVFHHTLNMATTSMTNFAQNHNLHKNPIKLDRLVVDSRITSEKSPYTIIDVAHVVVDPQRPEIKGRLSISICPGKKDERWNRNLELDLLAIKNNGIKVIVCMIEWSEMTLLNITEYPRRAQELGFIFYHLPTKDRRAPLDKEVNCIIPIIVQHLSNGDNVLVRCRGGLGRAGTICSCCLTHFGYDGVGAIELVRRQRPGAIQTNSQTQCIMNYERSVNIIK